MESDAEPDTEPMGGTRPELLTSFAVSALSLSPEIRPEPNFVSERQGQPFGAVCWPRGLVLS